MPSFAIGNKVRGLNFSNEIVLGAPGEEVNAVARLTGPVLFLPSTESLTFKCKYEDATNRRTLVLKFESAAGLPFIEGQLALKSLEVRVWFPQGAGSVAPILTDPQSVSCQGTAEWRQLPPALGLNNNQLTFTVEYRHDGAGVGVFVLRLTQAIDIPVLFCRLLQAEISAEPLVSEEALVVTLNGSATLTQAARTTVAPLLDPLFGNGAVNRLTQPKFFYRQKFKLGQPVGVPTVGLSMDWNGAVPSLPNIPAGLGVSIKGPRFNFALPDFNTPPATLNVRFPECSLRFPGVRGMQPLELGGAFDVRRDAATNTIKLSFFPTLPGGVDLPLIIRLFFSRLAWSGAALGDLVSHAQVTLDEAEWVGLFQALLPATGTISIGPFTTSLRQLITSALSGTSFGPERLFVLIFEAFSGRADSGQLFGIVWTEWLSVSARATPASIAGLLPSLSSLSPGTLRVGLAALIGVSGLNLTAVLHALMPQPVDFGSAAYLNAQRLIVQFIGGLIDVLAPDAVAAILINAWQNAPAGLRPFASLTDPRFAKFDLSFRAITRLICEGLSVLVLLADENLKLLRGLLPEIQLPQTERFIQHLLSPVTNLFDELDRGLFPPWSKLLPMLKAMAAYASGDRSREILLLEASKYPVSGIAITIGALLLALERPTPWTGMLGQNIETLPGLKTKRLPPPFEHPTDPTKSVKYFILSDVHRDAVADNRGTFNFGSIHHFSKNKTLYLEVLEKADAGGYTVIEGGDCEELWFIRDFDTFQGFPQLMRDIMAAHTQVYNKLRDMHKRGRYFRVHGNHDSYLRDADVFEPLRTFMQTGHSIPFEIYDFILIADVKGMSDVVETFTDWPTAVSAASTSQAWATATLQNFASRVVGLDSRPYKGRKQLIVTHGHQWDFWNCDEHNLVGKMLANMVGVTVDKLMDPFTDAEGIAFFGNPFLDFRDVAAFLFPSNSWLSGPAALRITHAIQHMHENVRQLDDNVTYSESLVALSAAFCMPLDKYTLKTNNVGEPILDAGGRPQYDKTALATQTNQFKRAMEHHGHLICIGHTHAPHSMPYYPIARMLFGPVLGDVINFIHAHIPIVGEVRFKSGYLNSGTSGWFEGVVWGVEVHETGQPRLVYWTPGANKPYRMDWELDPWDKAKRQRFDQILAGTIPNIEKYFEELAARFGGAAMEIAGAMLPVFSLPPELVPLLSTGNRPVPSLNLDDAATESPVERMQSVLLQVFGMFQRLANDPNISNTPQVFTISARVPPVVEARLVEFQAQISAGLNVSDPLRQAAGLVFALANLERLTRGVRQFPDLSLDDQGQLDRVWMLLLTLMVIPNSQKFTTNIALANGTLTLTITLRR